MKKADSDVFLLKMNLLNVKWKKKKKKKKNSVILIVYLNNINI